MNLPFSVLKYLVSALLVFILIRRGHRMPQFWILGLNVFIILLIIALLRAFPNIMNNDFDGIVVWKNYLWFPILLYIYSNITESTNILLSDYLRQFVNFMCLYIVANLFFYYIPIPFLITEPHRYWGRLTVGYPTIDVILIGWAIAIVFFSKYEWSKSGFLMRALILCVGMLMQASGTGMVFLILLLILTVFYLKGVWNPQPIFFLKRKRRCFILLLLIFMLGGFFVLAIFQKQNEELYDAMIAQVENRMFILLGMEDEAEISVNTMDIREDRMKRAEDKFLTNGDKKLFGLGYGWINMKEERANKILTEDQITMNKVTIGLLGNIVYFGVLFSLLFYIVKRFRNTSNIYIYISAWFFLLLSSFTSNCLLSFGPINIWCLVFSLLLSDNKRIRSYGRKFIC